MSGKTYQHAVFCIPGDSHQHKAEPGGSVVVEKLVYEVGEVFSVETVLMAWNSADDLQVGMPYLKNVRAKLIVTAQFKGEKINAFTYKAKKNQRKRWGHRQRYTRLNVLAIEEC